MDTIVPSAAHIAQVMLQATAPAFVLGAVAGFINVLLGRMTSVIERIRSLNEIPDKDATRGHLRYRALATADRALEECHATGTRQRHVRLASSPRRIYLRVP
jgi:Protein of unknown function (DUF2721)